MRRFSFQATFVAALLAGSAMIVGCGGGSKLVVVNHTVAVTPPTPTAKKVAVPRLGFPILATINTTRVDGAGAIEDAAGVAQAVYPGLTPATRPQAVTIAPTDTWQAALASAVLMAAPIHAPILLSGTGTLPATDTGALSALRPRGAGVAKGAQVIKVGDVPTPTGLRSVGITGANPFALAAAIDTFQTAAAGTPSPDVIVTSADAPAYAMPAAGYAALSGDPILYVTSSTVPQATRQAILAHGHPRIYVLGPDSVIPHAVTKTLDKLGRVRRVDGSDPITNAVVFSRYRDPPCPSGAGCIPGQGNFGWAVTSGGHGYVFANVSQPLAAAAAAPLSASGQYGPLLLIDNPAVLPQPDANNLLNNASGYNQEGPTAAVYNHGWIIGNQIAVSGVAQAEIDSLLRVLPAK
ncbi:MAG: cell wall-binding repeat-containing protein [Actinomycetota bacterium]|nr:cell wall-binding repeat-containing protein [Actinomycetota bacterium]